MTDNKLLYTNFTMLKLTPGQQFEIEEYYGTSNTSTYAYEHNNCDVVTACIRGLPMQIHRPHSSAEQLNTRSYTAIPDQIQWFDNPLFDGLHISNLVFTPRFGKTFIIFDRILNCSSLYYFHSDIDVFSIKDTVNIRGEYEVGYGVYSSYSERVYLIPKCDQCFNRIDKTTYNIYYIDCIKHIIRVCVSPTPFTYNTFIGATYCRALNRIYLSTVVDTIEQAWYYIDCDNNTFNKINNMTKVCIGKYKNGVSCDSIISIDNKGTARIEVGPRIYITYTSTFRTTSIKYLYYIDCLTGNICNISIPFDIKITNVYSVLDNNILYFIPLCNLELYSIAYFDCRTQIFGKFEHGMKFNLFSMIGVIHCPKTHRVYMINSDCLSNFACYIDCITKRVQSYVECPMLDCKRITHGNLLTYVYIPTQSKIYIKTPYINETTVGIFNCDADEYPFSVNIVN